MHPGTAALERGLRILDLLGEPESAIRGLGVAEVADHLGIAASQASRGLATLVALGWAERHADGSHHLGPRVHLLAAATREARLLRVAHPVLVALARHLGECVHLSVRQGDRVLTLASELPPDTAIVVPARVGGLTPLATTSSGRVLASGLDPAELAELGLDASALAAVAAARRDGCAIVREEFESGLVAAAAPIRDAAGEVVAALNVSAPAFRLAATADAAAEAVRAAADRVSAGLVEDETPPDVAPAPRRRVVR